MASYVITSPPSSRTDTGILAQQSDVRCKRGRLGVIMIAPAAHTSKGLAKAFVSSAGGKGLENQDTPAPLSSTLRGARLPSTVCKPGGCDSKVPLCREDVCRVVPPGYAALCQKVHLEQGP